MCRNDKCDYELVANTHLEFAAYQAFVDLIASLSTMLEIDTIVKPQLKETNIACIKNKQLPITEFLYTEYFRDQQRHNDAAGK